MASTTPSVVPIAPVEKSTKLLEIDSASTLLEVNPSADTEVVDAKPHTEV